MKPIDRRKSLLVDIKPRNWDFGAGKARQNYAKSLMGEKLNVSDVRKM